MRLWSIHPRYLDTKGIVALWREGLLAQKVLMDSTRGYKHHPQLARFRGTHDPCGAISLYLQCVAEEAKKRAYNFDRDKIRSTNFDSQIPVTVGQIKYEFSHLLSKLKYRDLSLYTKLKDFDYVECHPMFDIVDGDVEGWEKIR